MNLPYSTTFAAITQLAANLTSLNYPAGTAVRTRLTDLSDRTRVKNSEICKAVESVDGEQAHFPRTVNTRLWAY